MPLEAIDAQKNLIPQTENASSGIMSEQNVVRVKTRMNKFQSNRNHAKYESLITLTNHHNLKNSGWRFGLVASISEVTLRRTRLIIHG